VKTRSLTKFRMTHPVCCGESHVEFGVQCAPGRPALSPCMCAVSFIAQLLYRTAVVSCWKATHYAQCVQCMLEMPGIHQWALAHLIVRRGQ